MVNQPDSLLALWGLLAVGLTPAPTEEPALPVKVGLPAFPAAFAGLAALPFLKVALEELL